MTEVTEDQTCQCCTFGNHTGPCTCDGAECCHRERHKVGGLRDWIAAALDECRVLIPTFQADAVMLVVAPVIQRKEEQRMDAAIEAGNAEATIARVRAECDRIEAAVRDNPQDPAFDAGYLAPLKWIRHALDGTEDDDAPPVAYPRNAQDQP